MIGNISASFSVEIRVFSTCPTLYLIVVLVSLAKIPSSLQTARGERDRIGKSTKISSAIPVTNTISQNVLSRRFYLDENNCSIFRYSWCSDRLINHTSLPQYFTCNLRDFYVPVAKQGLSFVLFLKWN